MDNGRLQEARLKAAVIDRLMSGAQVDDEAVIVSEMVVANWTRRADVVLANGRLWAFEIKSEADSLTRLAGQIDVYRSHFEKVVVVAAAKFEDAVMAAVPDGVGVWIAGEGAEIEERVRPRQSELSSSASLSLMTATDLRRLLVANGVGPGKDAPRARLEELAAALPRADLACAARASVKRRHRHKHDAFLRCRSEVGTLSAMSKLGWERRASAEPAEDQDELQQFRLPEVSVSPEHPCLVNAPSGPVLRRQRRSSGSS